MTNVTPGLADALHRVGDRWTLQVVDALQGGPRRFADLEAAIAGLAPNTLSARLRMLEGEGVVLARPYSRRPLRSEYELTERGRELAGALRLLASWGLTADPSAEPPRHEACGTPVETRWWCPTCEEVVADPTEESELRWL